LSGLDGAILFLEDLMHKGLGFVDRLLTQLIRSGSLSGIAGIALGSFEGFRDIVDRGWTIVDVLRDRLGGLGVPIVGGIFAGHDLIGRHGGPDQVALPLGADANLDADAGSISSHNSARRSRGTLTAHRCSSGHRGRGIDRRKACFRRSFPSTRSSIAVTSRSLHVAELARVTLPLRRSPSTRDRP